MRAVVPSVPLATPLMRNNDTIIFVHLSGTSVDRSSTTSRSGGVSSLRRIRCRRRTTCALAAAPRTTCTTWCAWTTVSVNDLLDHDPPPTKSSDPGTDPSRQKALPYRPDPRWRIFGLVTPRRSSSTVSPLATILFVKCLKPLRLKLRQKCTEIKYKLTSKIILVILENIC